MIYCINFICFWYMNLNQSNSLCLPLIVSQNNCHFSIKNAMFTLFHISKYECKHSLITCNTEFSSLLQCSQPHIDSLWCLRINPMYYVNHSYQCNGGTVRLDIRYEYKGCYYLQSEFDPGCLLWYHMVQRILLWYRACQCM